MDFWVDGCHGVENGGWWGMVWDSGCLFNIDLFIFFLGDVLLFQLLDGLLEIVGKTYYYGFMLLILQKS